MSTFDSTFDESGVLQRAPHLAELIGSQPAMPPDEDRAHGVLLGLAVGNLLGLPVESAPRHVIRRAYPEGLSEIESAERYRALDDDLAQAVELAESLAQDDDLLIGFGDRLVRWRASNGRGIGYMTSTVIDGLEDGLGVPGAARAFWLDQGSPETQPNGGLMRCAPVAVQLARNPDALIERTAATCAVTHFAPGAQWSCVLVNAAIAMLLRGHTPSRDDLIGAAQEDGAPQELVEWARATPRTSDGITERIAGERMIGHTYLCMQAAIWSLDTEDDLEHALIRIVNAGGDTDTNGAVAGAVLGARYGASAIPERWVSCVPQRDRIEIAVADLITVSR